MLNKIQAPGSELNRNYRLKNVYKIVVESLLVRGANIIAKTSLKGAPKLFFAPPRKIPSYATDNNGKEYCLEVLEKFLKQDGLDDFFYTWIPGFLGDLGSNISELSQVGQRYGVAKYEVYINSIDMFGIFTGKNNIVLPAKGGPNIDYALGVVPQIVQLDLQDGQMVCRSCQEPGLKNTTNCQKILYVILHQYAFPISEHGEYIFENLTAQETIEKFYVTSFIHGLESWLGAKKNSAAMSRSGSEKEQNYNFFYNKKFQSVKNLHCEGSLQWEFNKDLNINIPFLLETGINSCEVKNCPGWQKSLGNAWASVEFAYLIIILIISIVILLVLFKFSGGQNGDNEEGVQSFRETLAAFIDQIRDR